MSVRTITVDLGERSYEVVVGDGLLVTVGDLVRDRAPEAARAAIVTQPPVAAYAEVVADSLRTAGLDVATLEVSDGEMAKNPRTLARLWDDLAAVPLGRRDVVVAVGGGVIGDLAGFAAATWNRGVPVAQVPTTLLAQVDAAIGGKTGIDLPAGKNLVGAFHQPTTVVCDVTVLATLPQRQLVAGLAEVVKCGLIRDPTILDLLEEEAGRAVDGDPEVLRELVARSAAVKAAVVAADETEGGEREHLNLGHTVGHAIETVGGYTDHLHGEAVAIGTCAALRLGVRVGRTPEELVARTETLLQRLGLPTRVRPLRREAIWAAMARDKKARDGVRFVVLDDLARPTVLAPPREAVDAVLDEVEEER